MIAVREVPEPGTVDLFEDSLLLPIPGPESNSILLEDRDGKNVRRISAKAALIERDGKRLARVADVRIDVFITDARVALACSKYDKGGGWIGGGAAIALNVGSKALAAMRRHGKMLVGQVRYPWLARIGSTTKFGWQSEERLYFEFKSPEGKMQLVLTLPKNIDAASVAAEIAHRAAAYRLACEPEEDAKWRARCENLTRAERLEPIKGKVYSHVFPNYWTIGEKSARMLPVLNGGASLAAPVADQVAGQEEPAGASAAADTPELPASPTDADAPATVAAIADTPAADEPASVAFCTTCGSSTKPDLAFCTQCGARLATP